MAEKPVLVIAAERVRADRLAHALAAIRRRHPSAKLFLLTSMRQAQGDHAQHLADEIWAESQIRGFFRLLALTRRISWAGVGTVYDLEQSGFSRFLWLSVWPRPHWLGSASLLS